MGHVALDTDVLPMDNSHIARPGKTVTAVSARFHNGRKAVRIGALFWVEGSSSTVLTEFSGNWY